jgi:hypothetical protein
MFQSPSRGSRSRRAVAGAALVFLSMPLVGPATAQAAPSDAAGRDSTASAPNASSSSADSEKKTSGVLGPVRLGAFGGVGFPRPFSIEGMVKIGDVVGIGLEYSALPQLTVSGVSASLSAVDAEIRVFPLRNGFFFGVAAGHQQLSASATGTVPTLGTITEQLSAESWFVNPRIGFLWTLRWGLTIGMDAGAQIPITSSVSSTIPTELASNANAIARVFNGDVLPTVTLLRLGFLF